MAVGAIVFLTRNVKSASQISRHRHESPVRSIIQREALYIGFLRKVHLQTMLICLWTSKKEILFSKERQGISHGLDALFRIQDSCLDHVLFIQIQKINFRIVHVPVPPSYFFNFVHISS